MKRIRRAAALAAAVLLLFTGALAEGTGNAAPAAQAAQSAGGTLKKGSKGDGVLRLQERLQELGYIRGSSDLNNVYNDITSERVMLFQRQLGITEDGVASQELQAYLFSEKAPMCSQALPKARSQVPSDERRTVCGCCMGEGCECCNFKGWITY